MEIYLQYVIPVLAFALLAAGWMGMQILAKKMKVKNHIDSTGGCCGACENRNVCDKKVEPH
jgi:hypothetical protein